MILTDPPEIIKILDWCERHQRSLTYTENDPPRMSNLEFAGTDCSGLARRLYWNFARINIGSYTGNEDSHGWLITTSKTVALHPGALRKGDLVFYLWPGGSGPWSHVNIYGGGDLVYNHGGPNKGPIRESLRENVNAATRIMVRRIMEPISSPVVVKPTPKPAPKPSIQEDDMFVQFPDGKTPTTIYQVSGGYLIPLTREDYTAIGSPAFHVIKPASGSNYYKLTLAPGFHDSRI